MGPPIVGPSAMEPLIVEPPIVGQLIEVGPESAAARQLRA